MIIRKIPYYEFQDNICAPLENAEFLNEPFYLTFPIPSAEYLSCLTEDSMLLRIPDAFTLRLINRSYVDDDPNMESMRKEGCFYFKDEKEWILEAVCGMSTLDGHYQDTYVVRLPLSAPFAMDGELGVYFDGTWIRFMKDGRILNENTGLDRFALPTGEVQIDPLWQQAFRVGAAKRVQFNFAEEIEDQKADFYTPKEWNAFAGDVMNFYHDGIYHLMYLKDRRHHGSRNGNGAHEIYHLTTTDLQNWTEQEPIAVIDRPWKTYGTGTMLYHANKYYMVYGYHTERYQGANQQVQCKLNEEKMEFAPLSIEEILSEGMLPAGASYSVSEDGIHFVSSGVLFHPGRNPSTYAMPNGKVRVYAGYMGSGVWESERLGMSFYQAKEDVSFVSKSVMKNSTECPSFFEWNGYKYLIIGFTGYYRTLAKDSSEYVDMAGSEEIYDGLCVPMVSKFGTNRYLIAGWLSGLGWGSVIVHRELVQENRGRLGMKWVPELIPQTEDEPLYYSKESSDKEKGILLEKESSYLIEGIIELKEASRVGVQFMVGDQAVEFQLDFEKKRMQIMETVPGEMAASIPTSYEIAMANGRLEWKKADANIARNTKNFCLSGVEGIEGSFSLKILLRYSKKLRSTVIDVEVAGRRTMISVRKEFFPESLLVVGEGKISIKDFVIKKLK